MKILANENLYEPMIDYLRTAGHDVVSCRSRELSGSSDDAVYRKAVAEGRLIVTMDKDFLRMDRFPPSACGGIVVVKDLPPHGGRDGTALRAALRGTG